MVGRVQVLLRTEQLRKNLNMLDTSKVIETAAQNQGGVHAAQMEHIGISSYYYTQAGEPPPGAPTASGTGTRASASASATGSGPPQAVAHWQVSMCPVGPGSLISGAPDTPIPGLDS
jgi:hypothetical protein